MKRTIALLLSSTLLLSPALGAGMPDFFDVAPRDWFAPYVEVCVQEGLMKGIGNGRFGPEQSFTTGECIALAARLHCAQRGDSLPAAPAGYLSQEGDWGPYPQWFADAHAYFTQTLGLTLTTAWRLPVSRGEWIRIMALGVTETQLTPIFQLSALPDTEDPTVLAFYNAGILGGTDALGSFNPADWDVTRGEAAALLARIVQPSLRLSTAPEPLGYTLTPLPLPAGYNGFGEVSIYNFSVDEYRTFGDYVYLEEAGHMGVLALDGSWLLSPDLGFDAIAPFCSDGVAAAQREGKWGYLDKDGREVVPLSYREVSHLHDGILLAVTDSGEYHVFAPDGAQTATLPATCDTYDGLVVFDTTGGSIRYTQGGKMGYLNGDGTLLLAARWYDAQPFSQGLAAVRNSDFLLEPGHGDDGGRYGYIDESGNLKIPYEFGSPSVFTGGIASYLREGYLTPDGTLHPTEDFGGFRKQARFSEGYIPWFDGDTLREGYMDLDGKLLTPDLFLDTTPLSGGQALVRDAGGDHFVLTVATP